MYLFLYIFFDIICNCNYTILFLIKYQETNIWYVSSWYNPIQNIVVLQFINKNFFEFIK